MAHGASHICVGTWLIPGSVSTRAFGRVRAAAAAYAGGVSGS